MSTRSPKSVLLAATGLAIGGGIASVSRCIARAFDEAIAAGTLERADRVLLLEPLDAAHPPPAVGDQRLAGGSQLRFVQLVWRSLRTHRPDLVLFDHMGPARSMTLPFLRGRRYAVFVHGAELVATKAAGALLGAERILTNSEFTRGLVKQRYPESPPIHVVPLCIDPARSEQWEASGVRSGAGEAAPNARAPAAVIVGRMLAEERGKGHDHLLEAWPRVRERVASAELWIVGDGDDRSRLEQRARELGLGASVRFLGRISDEELLRVYRTASLLAMPSRQEGFGLVYAEALHQGLPCLGSTADAAGQVIRDGVNGRLVTYGDVAGIARVIAELLSSPETLQRMGTAGREEALHRFAYPRFRRDLYRALNLPPAADAARVPGA